MDELRRIRHLRGMSQEDLAKASGVSDFTISELEGGKRPNPRPSTLRKLANALGVDVATLYGEEIPSPKESPDVEPLLTVPFESFIETIRAAANRPNAADARRELEALAERIKNGRHAYLAAHNSDPFRVIHRTGRVMSMIQASRRREFWEQIKDLNETDLEDTYRDIERQRAEGHSQLEQAKERFEEGALTPSEMGEFYRRIDDITSKSLLASFQLHNLRHPEHRDETEQEAEKILVGAAPQ